ncbi:MAG: galactose-1-epimerase [Lactovum sp.]
MKITKEEFGLGATLICLTNQKGNSISFSNLGARVVAWEVTGRNILRSYKTAREYLEKDPYCGATIGRVAGRIKAAYLKINNQEFNLQKNEGEQTLHGGEESFETKLWRFESFESETSASVTFSLISNHMENGFPGKLEVKVTYSYDDEDNWTIDYEALSDQDTSFNPTNHVYFNLNQSKKEDISNHFLEMSASRYLSLKNEEKVDGQIKEVTGTDFDFQSAKLLSKIFESQESELLNFDGLDHPFLLDEVSLEKTQATLSLDDLSLRVKTDRPSLVIFTANFKGVDILEQESHKSITFESQVAPGAESNPELGDISLKAGEKYQSRTIYQVKIGE